MRRTTDRVTCCGSFRQRWVRAAQAGLAIGMLRSATFTSTVGWAVAFGGDIGLHETEINTNPRRPRRYSAAAGDAPTLGFVSSSGFTGRRSSVHLDRSDATITTFDRSTLGLGRTRLPSVGVASIASEPGKGDMGRNAGVARADRSAKGLSKPDQGRDRKGRFVCCATRGSTSSSPTPRDFSAIADGNTADIRLRDDSISNGYAKGKPVAVENRPTERIAANPELSADSEWSALLQQRLERKLRKPKRLKRRRALTTQGVAEVGNPEAAAKDPNGGGSVNVPVGAGSTEKNVHDVVKTSSSPNEGSGVVVGACQDDHASPVVNGEWVAAVMDSSEHDTAGEEAEDVHAHNNGINQGMTPQLDTPTAKMQQPRQVVVACLAGSEHRVEGNECTSQQERRRRLQEAGPGESRRSPLAGSSVGDQATVGPPLKKRPPGGPFGASKSWAWHAQQVVQSAVTPLQAMRAVLDRPLRANSVTISTALNRVAKLRAERPAKEAISEEERKCLGVLLKVTEELVESDMVNARNLAQLLWSLAKLGNPKASAGQLLSHPEEGLREIGPLRFGSRGAETVQAAKGLETPQRKRRPPSRAEGRRLPALIAGKLSERACECKPMELAMAAWGLAVLGERDELCLSAIAKEVSVRAGDFEGRELGNIVWAFAVLGYRDRAMLEAVAEVLSPEPLQWQGRVSWAWKDSQARKGRTTGEWKATIDRRWKAAGQGSSARPAAEVVASAAAAQAATKMASTNATAPAAGDSTPGTLEETAGSTPAASDAAAGVTTAAAAAAASAAEPNGTGDSERDVDAQYEEDSMAALSGQGGLGVGDGLDDADRRSGADTASAPRGKKGEAGVRLRAPDLSSLLGNYGGGYDQVFDIPGDSARDEERCSQRHDRQIEADEHGYWDCTSEVQVASVVLTPQELAMLSWGFSALTQEWLPGQPAAYRAVAVLAKAARRCVGSFRPQDISMVSLALARLSWDDPSLMKAMTARTTEKLRAFKPQELSNMAWACARLYVQDIDFWISLQDQAKRMLAGPGMRPQETANLAWALAVTGDADSALLADLLRSAEAHRSELTAVESHQLYQVYLLWSDEIPDLWEELDSEFLLELKRKWTDNQERMKRSSFSHLEVSETLELMQICHENESEHDIDIEIVGVGLASEDWDFRSFATGTGPNPADPAEVRLKVALEVDGPAHFTKNTARPLGHMVLKHRTLTKMGWTVVSIPFFEWDPIPFWSSMEKKRYLQRKLGITRTIFFGGIDCSRFKGWSARLGKTSRYH